MFVLGCIHAAPQDICRVPDLFLKSYVSRIDFGHNKMICI